MYSLYYKGLRLGVTFQVKPLCVGDFASFAKFFAGLYFGRGIDLKERFKPLVGAIHELPLLNVTGIKPQQFQIQMV